MQKASENSIFRNIETVMCSKTSTKGRVVLGVIWGSCVNSSKNFYYTNCRLWLQTCHHIYPPYTHAPGHCLLETLLASLSYTSIIICRTCKQLAPKGCSPPSKISSMTEAKPELQIQFYLSCLVSSHLISSQVWYVKFRWGVRGNPKGNPNFDLLTLFWPWRINFKATQAD